MKKYLLLLSLPVLAIGLMLLSSFGGDANADYPGGSPAGYTGSPGDGKDCHNCHGGSTSFVDGWITSDIPPEGYIPGNVYNMTVTVTGSGDKGFQVSAQDPSGLELGTLIAGTGSHLNGGTKYVNHNSKKTSNPATWQFQWIAPPPGTGEVTFYGAFTVNKPVTKTSTLLVQEGSVTPLEVDATADPEQICTGDSSHLDVIVSGGTGTYSYTWTSDPPGFTSDLKDPWVYPLESSTYYVDVISGDITVTDSVFVAVYCLGTEEFQEDVMLTIFPNPVSHMLNLTLSVPFAVNAELSVYSISGKLVMSHRMTIEPFSSSIRLDVSSLPEGTYLLLLRDGEKQISRKIVKSN